MPSIPPVGLHGDEDEEEHMPTIYHPYDFLSGDDTADSSSLMKDEAYLALQPSDGDADAMFNCPGYNLNDFGQSQAVDEPEHCHSMHRGSTSSSSSMQSGGGSNSPDPTDPSFDKFSGGTGGNEMPFDEFVFSECAFESRFNGEATADFERYIASDSGPTPQCITQFSPESRTFGADLSPARAVKRRRAQRTKQPANRPSNMAGMKSPMESPGFSPIPAQIPSTEPSPTALYADKNHTHSPDGNVDIAGDVSVGVSTNWLPASNRQGIHPLYTSPRPDPMYIPLAEHELSNGNPSAPLPQSPSPRLVIHPMPGKSRVETQIPLKITVHNLPEGIKRVHLPTHTIAKPKLLEKPPPGSSADMLELTTMLVCSSAMNDQTRLERAFARAARKPNVNDLSSPVDDLEDEENKPQSGGEVRICPGCIIRERKRAGRKKHKKPEEEELWDRYERERAIVFNTNEVKEWQTVTTDMADPTKAGIISNPLPPGIVQVDAPMRIACYCRHHGEKIGFQVVITLKDYTGKVVAQEISSSIMITDDHKTPPVHAGPTPTPQQLHQHQSPQPHSQPPVTNGLTIPLQAGVSQPVMTHTTPIQPRGIQPLTSFRPNSRDSPSLPFRHTHSMCDIQTQGQSFPLNMPSLPNTSTSQPTTMVATPHNLSRQTSPMSPIGPGSRKRKASVIGIRPGDLVMTKLEPTVPSNVQNDSTMVSPGTSPFTARVGQLGVNLEYSNEERHMLNNVSQQVGGGPPTQNNSGMEPFQFAGIKNRSMNLLQTANQLYSAPVSAHPSRAPSPNQLRPDPQSLQHPQRPQHFNHELSVPPPTIHRVIPGEGPKCGGVEITILGSHFTNDGLEVYFGTQKATTTTFWGEQSLVCLLPPSPNAATVPVTIKQPGRWPTMQPQPQPPRLFTYKDDDEDQLIRSALEVLAGHYGSSVTDPTSFARSILLSHTTASGSSNHGSHTNNVNGAFTSFSLGTGEAAEANLLRILDLMDQAGPPKARIDLRRSSGQTMLHRACSLGFIRFVAGLLFRGANVHIQDNGGFTALHMAAMNDHPEVVRQLIAKGADRDMPSFSGLTPLDVARSRSVRRNLQQAENDFRSRSVDLRRRSRASSSDPSLEYSTVTPTHRRGFPSGNLDTATTTNDDSSEEPTTEEDVDWLDARKASFVEPRRRSTVKSSVVNEANERQPSPNPTMAAIREQFATQLQQLQHTMTMHFQNIQQFQMPNIPQIPNSYQAYLQSAPVMQRITSLVPNMRGQRQGHTDDDTTNPTDSKRGVFPFFGNKDSPPAYEEIFPQKDLDIKQSSAAQAAAEAEADTKCAALFDQNLAETSQTQEVPTLLQIGRKHLITKEQQETLQRAHAQRLKAGSSDKMLWFVWIPILIFVLGAMLWSGAPSLVSGTTSVVKTLSSLVANPREISTRVRNIVLELT